ncbi:PfkB family carbohydrate kinase [Lentzea sp. NPDC004782]|uniref:carbohydrate kinase family protein n=1 Tax=Lentzea sp. NPDC004782 TaxID=3154458 RepID=UPI0033B1748A
MSAALDQALSEVDGERLWAAATGARVLVVGSLNVDLILETRGEQPPDEGAVEVHTATTLVGGHAGNCASALAALGIQVSVAGAVGTDPDGDLLIADLVDRGVDVTGVRRRADQQTGRVVIPVFGEKHYMLLIRGANDSFGADDLRDVLDDEYDAVMLFDPNVEALRAVRSQKGLLCWTPGGVYSAHPVAAQVVPHCDVVFVNRTERDQLARHVADVPGELVVTLGGDGSMLRHGSEEIVMPARRVPVVDPTGAGDAFAATYLLTKLAGVTASSRLATANVSGALAVGATGARSRLATLPDLLQHVSENRNG